MLSKIYQLPVPPLAEERHRRPLLRRHVPRWASYLVANLWRRFILFYGRRGRQWWDISTSPRIIRQYSRPYRALRYAVAAVGCPTHVLQEAAGSVSSQMAESPDFPRSTMISLSSFMILALGFLVGGEPTILLYVQHEKRARIPK